MLADGLPARRIADLEVRLAALKIALAAGEREIESRQEALSQTQRRIEEQALALAETQSECQALERLLSESLAAGSAEHCEDCPNLDCARRADLAGRLVLCVGGRLTHVRELSRLVARCNGRFDHHDGGLEDRDRRLEALLAGADAVICATDFVSHSAYYRTKQFCKRHDKPHILLPRSGLSAFALALERGRVRRPRGQRLGRPRSDDRPGGDRQQDGQQHGSRQDRAPGPESAAQRRPAARR